MMQRSGHLPIYVSLIGILVFSISLNIWYWNKNYSSEKTYSWVTKEQMQEIEKEIKRLENQSNNTAQ